MDSGVIVLIIFLFLLVLSPFIIWSICKSKRASDLRNGYHQLKVGMTEKEVYELLGNATDIGEQEDGTKILFWRNKETINKGFLRASEREIKILMKNGKVVSFEGKNIDSSII